jgi:hypothetical protein
VIYIGLRDGTLWSFSRMARPGGPFTSKNSDSFLRNYRTCFSLCGIADSVQLMSGCEVSMKSSVVNMRAEELRPLNSICLQNAVLCAECDVVSDSPHDQCLVCGSRSLFNIPGTELNRRRQPFQGCSHPNLSSCNPYHYRRSYLHFDQSYWTHNGPNNQTQCGYRSSPRYRPNAD